MSDERSPSAATDEADAADDATSASDSDPGGGPQRVVSEESVDDILESLDSTPGEPSENASTTVTATPASIDPTPDSTGNDPTDDIERRDSSGEPAESPDSSDAIGSATVDSAAASLPDDASDASPEDLAARVEHGDVTGADVRAAEAGEGRESTPEIDDVELSMDDLETTRTGGTDAEENWPDDAGPLAGSVEGDTAAESDGDEDGSPGLLGRLTQFFSR